MFIKSVAIQSLLFGIAAVAAQSNLQYEPIAGYAPRSQVTDHNAIDLDQRAFEEQIALKSNAGFGNAKAIYAEGAFSKSFAKIMLATGLSDAVVKGTPITGVSASGSTVQGKALEDFPAGSRSIDVQYVTSNNQATYSSCQVGALGALATDELNLSGCFASSGSIRITGVGSVAYTYRPRFDNNNGRTIQGFSTQAAEKMLNCPIGCPYPDFQKFYDYYGVADYADKWVMASLDGRATSFSNGNADFSTGIGNDINLRAQTAKKGTAYMNVWMYVLREFEDALDDCKIECVDCNDDPVIAWDEAVAFYTGSSHGSQRNSVQDGWLLYALANKRCENFKTCGDGNAAISGNSNVNIRLFALFQQGQTEIRSGMCQAARTTKNKIAKLMAVPLVQGVIRYAFIIGQEGSVDPDDIGEGAAFAAAVLPIVHHCSSADARIIYNNMRVRNPNVSFAAVKSALERNYECMGITCEDVGGYYDAANEEYFPLAAPCGTTTPVFCFSGDSEVQVKGEGPVPMRDLKIGDEILVGDENYDSIYSFGHYKPNAEADYLVITLVGGNKPLKLSRDHMIFDTKGTAIPASAVKVGDEIAGPTGEALKVQSVKSTNGKGAYAPFTYSGKLVVNGILASSYVTMDDEKEAYHITDGFSMSYQYLAHSFQAPHRMLCKMNPKWCASETYNNQGLSHWLEMPFQFFKWAMAQTPAIKNTTIILTAMFVTLWHGFEILFNKALSVVGIALVPLTITVAISILNLGFLFSRNRNK